MKHNKRSTKNGFIGKVVAQDYALRKSLSLALALTLAACASIPDDKHVMPEQDIARLQLAADIKLAREGWPQASWWKQYQDDQLNRLMEQALASSPGLAVVDARIGAARAMLAFNGADRGLTTGLSANDNRQRYSANGLFPAPIGGSYFNETTLQVQTRYDVDWWNKHRSQIAAALGEVNARRADYAQAEQVLAAAVVQSYIQMQGAFAQVNNVNATIVKQGALVADKLKRIKNGLATIDEQRLAEMDLNSLQQQVTQLQNQVLQQREVLRALIGADEHALMDVKPNALTAADVSLPSRLGTDLLFHRADLQAARWRVQASLSKVEVAQAAFYPDINLNAAIGLDALSWSDLLKGGSLTTYLGPTITLPLFDSKRLDARLGAARTERNEMIAEYNQQVFDAMRDVAQQALNVRNLEVQISQQQAQIHSSEQLLQSVIARYQHGLTDQAAYLTAELNVQKQRNSLLQLKDQAMLAQVNLIKNLGGSYQMSMSDTVVTHSPD